MEDKKLVAIQPNDLALVWPEIRAEVSTIEAPDGLIPEDVYMACKTNNAVLFMLVIDGKRVGWMVVRQFGSDLHIWQLRADNGYEVMKTFRPQLMEIARNANCTKLTYGSTREAWNKVSKQHGFKIRMVVYECPVDGPLSFENTGDADEDRHLTH